MGGGVVYESKRPGEGGYHVCNLHIGIITVGDWGFMDMDTCIRIHACGGMPAQRGGG